MNIQLPQNVSYIIGALNTAGHEAYAVGGCVRDAILGREPQDWDITTSALPEEVKAIFPRTVDTGIAHGTVTVMLGRDGYETTTYRIDGKYSDSRHPDEVSFTRSLSEDLKRRDFTINAMAYSESGLVDLFDGSGDLNRRLIRCVGNPLERFGEDALRILRAVRFSAQLGFEIDDDTRAAARQLAPTLANISAERIHVELHKLLMSPNPDRLMTLHELGIDNVIFPEFSALADSPECGALIDRLTHAPAERNIRWSLLLTYTGRAQAVMKRLKFDNLTIDTVSELIRLSAVTVPGGPAPSDETAMRRLMHNAGSDNIPLLLDFRRALEPDTDFTEAGALYLRMKEQGYCTSVKELAVNGRDLLAAGIPAGSAVGRMLDYLLDKVLDNPSLNTRETLISICKEASVSDGQ